MPISSRSEPTTASPVSRLTWVPRPSSYFTVRSYVVLKTAQWIVRSRPSSVTVSCQRWRAISYYDSRFLSHQGLTCLGLWSGEPRVFWFSGWMTFDEGVSAFAANCWMFFCARVRLISGLYWPFDPSSSWCQCQWGRGPRVRIVERLLYAFDVYLMGSFRFRKISRHSTSRN